MAVHYVGKPAVVVIMTVLALGPILAVHRTRKLDKPYLQAVLKSVGPIVKSKHSV
jgi:hypothetical protein